MSIERDSMGIEILRHVSQGKTNREIADDTGLGYKTVKKELSHVYRTLGVKNRQHAVAVALRKGLLE